MNAKFENFISNIEADFVLLGLDHETITNFLSKKYDELYIEKGLIVRWLIDKDNKTNFENYFLAAHCLRGIHGVFKDIDVAFGKFSRLADIQYPPSLFAMAVIYNEGIAGNHDEQKAFDFLLKSYELKFLPSYCALAIYYWYGCGIKKDKDLAISIFEEAIKEGYVVAEFIYGEELILQIGASEEVFQKGLKLIFNAAGKGNSDAVKFITHALCGDSGFKEEVRNYIKNGSSKKEEVFAVAEFIIYYRHTSPKFATQAQEEVMSEVAVKLLHHIKDWPKAANLLAYCYQQGIGVPIDIKEAYRLIAHVRTKVQSSLLAASSISLNESVLPKVVDESNVLKSVIEISPPTPTASPDRF
jgi:TPR repeat protein